MFSFLLQQIQKTTTATATNIKIASGSSSMPPSPSASPSASSSKPQQLPLPVFTRGLVAHSPPPLPLLSLSSSSSSARVRFTMIPNGHIRRWISYIPATIIILFLLITIVLHASLEALQDEQDEPTAMGLGLGIGIGLASVMKMTTTTGAAGTGRGRAIGARTLWQAMDPLSASSATAALRANQLSSRELAFDKLVQRAIHGAGGNNSNKTKSKNKKNGSDNDAQPGPTLRELFERQYPADNLTRIEQALRALRVPDPPVPPPMFPLEYDLYHCPDLPPSGYPALYPILDVLGHWNPDVTNIPADFIYQSLCIMDWHTDADKAERYRHAEVPFVMRNHPDVIRTAERWTSDRHSYPIPDAYQQQGHGMPVFADTSKDQVSTTTSGPVDYIQQLIGTKPQRNEHASKTNHVMFFRTWNAVKSETPPDWKPPADSVELTYADWKQKADAMERTNDETQRQSDHWYFRLNAALDGQNGYMYDELPFFAPHDKGSTLFMVEPEQQRGINCRFGMKGTIAEAHFDPTRNWIVVLRGQRRYILAPPTQCSHMALYPLGHPSGRHSSVNWSQPPPAESAGAFGQARVHEVVLQPGDALYLPTSYFHFIVSLNINYQCNARSGVTTESRQVLSDCGFPVG